MSYSQPTIIKDVAGNKAATDAANQINTQNTGVFKDAMKFQNLSGDMSGEEVNIKPEVNPATGSTIIPPKEPIGLPPVPGAGTAVTGIDQSQSAFYKGGGPINDPSFYKGAGSNNSTDPSFSVGGPEDPMLKGK
tara:strand:- start:245 stop:646 length:402 start_codon:yes stop_codon:yes gene_type:complete